MMDNERRALVESLANLLTLGSDQTALTTLLEQMHPAEIADALDDLPEEERRTVLTHLDHDVTGSILEESYEENVDEFVENLPLDELSKILETMPADEAADVLGRMQRREAEAVISLLPKAHGWAVRQLLEYPPETAGGIMNNEFFSVQPEATVKDILTRLREGTEAFESVNEIFVLREDKKFLGILPLEDLIAAEDGVTARDLMEKATITVTPRADREICALYVSKYNLDVLPVLDPSRRLLGIISSDDIIDVIEEEAEEDMFRLAGVGSDNPLDEGSIRRAFQRLPWFAVTIIGMSVLAFIISCFEVTLEKVAAVSFFIPAIMGLGGNVGIQASTITVRGLATEEIQFKDFGWLIRREMGVALIIGLICSAALGGVAYGMTQIGISGPALGHEALSTTAETSPTPPVEAIEDGSVTNDRNFALTVAAAMFAGILGSVLLGTSIPMLCHRVGIDPALASGPFVTTLIDIGTQSLYLSLATWILLS